MIRVMGAVAKIVQLKDLDDRVFYRQEKIYSEAQYQQSLDLQRAIKNGQILVLSRTEEKLPGFEAPEISKNVLQDSVEKKEEIEKSVSPEQIQALLQHIDVLEKKLEEKESKQPSLEEQNPLLQKLLDKVESLEARLSTEAKPDNDQLLEAVRRLEDKFTSDGNVQLLKKLEDIVTNAPQVGYLGSSYNTEVNQKKTLSTPEEVYVPSIKVEDGNSHIKLKTRTIEKSSNIDSAAEALRKLREGKS